MITTSFTASAPDDRDCFHETTSEAVGGASRTAAAASIASAATILGPARVVSIDRSGRGVVVEHIDAAGTCRRRAECAIPGHTVSVNDTVLVAGSSDALYIIGALRTRVPDNSASTRKAEPVTNGDRAEIEREGPMLRVRNERREIVFEYDESTRRSRLVAPPGDVEIAAPGGDIELRAAGTLRASGRDVELTARHCLRLSVSSAMAGAGRAVSSALQMVGGVVGVAGREVDVAAKTGRMHIDDCQVRGRSMRGRFGCMRITADRVERIVGRVIERAGTILQRVTGSVRTDADRVTTTTSGVHRIRAGRVDVQADSDVRIDGDRINLG